MKGSFSNTFGVVVGSCIVFGVIVALIGARTMDTGGKLGEVDAAIRGFLIGYPIGAIVGLLLVNRLLHYQGSLLWGILSIIIGGAVVVGIVSIIELLTYGPHGSVFKAGAWKIAGILFFFLGPPLIGILGFRLGYRKGKRSGVMSQHI